MGLIEAILEFLRVNMSNDFVQETLRQGPMESVFYLIFFPTVVIILFVFIISGWVIDRITDRSGNNPLKLLVSVAFYAFIILQGYYTHFITLSRIWFLVVGIIVGLWLFGRTFGPRHREGGGGGGHGGGMPKGGHGGGGITDYAIRKMKNLVTKDEEDIDKEINDRFKHMEAIIDQMENADPQAVDLGHLYNQFWIIKADCEETIKAFSRTLKAHGIKIEKGRIDKYWDDMTKLADRLKKIYKEKSKVQPKNLRKTG